MQSSPNSLYRDAHSTRVAAHKSLTAFALGVTLMLGLSPAVADVLVSNISETPRAATAIGNNPNPVDPPEGAGEPWYWIAQSFVTDNRTYRLQEIRMRLGDASSDPDPIVVAELHSGDSATVGPLLETLSVSGVAGGIAPRSLTPNSPVELQPNTVYWVVVGSQVPGDGTFFAQYAEGNNQTGSGSLGFFADSTNSGATWTYGVVNPYLIEVDVLNAATTVPLPLASLLTLGVGLTILGWRVARASRV